MLAPSRVSAAVARAGNHEDCQQIVALLTAWGVASRVGRLCMFITGGPVKKLCAGGGNGGHVLKDTLAAVCVDESGHLALVNAGYSL